LKSLYYSIFPLRRFLLQSTTVVLTADFPCGFWTWVIPQSVPPPELSRVSAFAFDDFGVG
jgi:hypothetical protein